MFNISELTERFGDTCDLVTRTIYLGGSRGKEVKLLFIEGLVASQAVGKLILAPLTDPRRFPDTMPIGAAPEQILGGGAFGLRGEKCEDSDSASEKLLSGWTVIFFPFSHIAVAFELRSPEKRAVTDAKEEKVLKGSKEAFTECLQTNCALVRRRVKTENLRLKTVSIGYRSEASVTVCYIEGFTPPDLVSEAVHRLKKMQVEGLITSSVIEECIADHPSSPLPQLIVTERADKFCLNLMEGRVGILADTLPVGYLAPGTLSQFMKAPEDEATHYIYASLQTLFRYTACIASLLLPAVYMALALYHQELIPLRILQSMIEAELEVPFPTAAEVFIMLAALEFLEEAGMRMPSPIGQTVSVIGALIIGQSAVEAKIVSPIIVVVVALAGTAEYTLPNHDLQIAVKLGRAMMLVLSSFFGLWGIGAGIIAIVIHLIRLKSFGRGYVTGILRYPGRAFLRQPMTVKRKEDPTI